MGVSAYAKEFASNNTSVRIGIFNSQTTAQLFFENLPPQVQNTIDRDQLWLNAYKSSSGFTEHHLEISGLSSDNSNNICTFAQSKNLQCLGSTKVKWNPSSATPSQKTAHTASHSKATKSASKLPIILKPLGVRVDSASNNTVKDFDLSLSDPYPLDGRVNKEHVHSYGSKFSLEPQNLDTKEARAAKAAYDVARNNFLSALQNIGDGVNNDRGDEAARDNLISLARQTFEAAGSAYLSGFLEQETTKADILSSNAGSGETFIHHVKQNLKGNARVSIDNFVSDVLSTATTDTELNIKKQTDAFMLSGARGVIDSGLYAARRSDLYALRNLELEYNLNNFEDSYFSILTTQPIYQSPDLQHNIFLQGGGIINEQSVDIQDDGVSRHTLNVGAAYRYLPPSEKYLIGSNIFLDHQWPYNHTRMSLGLDAKAENLNFATNYYVPLTDYRDSRTDIDGNEYEERALRGYDVEVGYTTPFLPALSVFGKGYQYFRDTDDDIRGLELSAEYKVRDNFLLKGTLVEENGGRDGFEMALQYRMPLYDKDELNLILADMQPAAGIVSMKPKIFEKVRRENRIRVEERLKTDTSIPNITAQFSALSIGLPFDVGGTATAALVNLPFDTAITIPNGDFGIINFSNGAIANLSASGGGDVIVEFNNTTLTVTATNGGFVQFISAGGGISVINVPGGTVNLTGTDIDITDDGTTTTIQVRAGSIEVVPNVGVAVLNGNQADVVSLTIASGATSLLINPALETRQEAAYTNLDLINPDPPATATSAPFINAAPALITGPQFVGNNADLRLTFSQAVTVAGAPFVNALVGVNPRTFAYNSGASSSTQLVFRHVYLAGDVGAASMTIQDLDLNGGTILGIANTLNAITAFTNTIVAINDLTTPSLIGSTPVDEEPLFSSGADIVLNFDENIQAGIGNIVLTDTTDGSDTRIVPIGDAQINIVGSTLTFNPTGILDLSTDYDLTIASGVIEDTSGNAFAGIISGQLNFTTSNDVTPPMLTGTTPTDNTTQLARNSTITLTFDEDVMLPGTINLVDTDDGSGTVAYTNVSPEINITNNVITITPATNLEYAENYEVTWIAGAIQDLVGNNAAASNSGDLNFTTVNLEAALVLTLNVTGVDGNIDENNVQGSGTPFTRTADAVMAADITIPVAPNGVIFEGGGTGIGAWVGFNNGDGVLRARGGDGVAVPTALAANAETALGGIPAGNFTLTWEFDVALGRVRVWLDENLIATDTAGGGFEANTWAGTDNFGYGAITAGNNSLGTGEITTAFNGTLLSDMRYYSSQTLP